MPKQTSPSQALAEAILHWIQQTNLGAAITQWMYRYTLRAAGPGKTALNYLARETMALATAEGKRDREYEVTVVCSFVLKVTAMGTVSLEPEVYLVAAGSSTKRGPVEIKNLSDSTRRSKNHIWKNQPGLSGHRSSMDKINLRPKINALTELMRDWHAMSYVDCSAAAANGKYVGSGTFEVTFTGKWTVDQLADKTTVDNTTMQKKHTEINSAVTTLTNVAAEMAADLSGGTISGWSMKKWITTISGTVALVDV